VHLSEFRAGRFLMKLGSLWLMYNRSTLARSRRLSNTPYSENGRGPSLAQILVVSRAKSGRSSPAFWDRL
jgi:hypothetical protein